MSNKIIFYIQLLKLVQFYIFLSYNKVITERMMPSAIRTNSMPAQSCLCCACDVSPFIDCQIKVIIVSVISRTI